MHSKIGYGYRNYHFRASEFCCELLYVGRFQLRVLSNKSSYSFSSEIDCSERMVYSIEDIAMFLKDFWFLWFVRKSSKSIGSGKASVSVFSARGSIGYGIGFLVSEILLWCDIRLACMLKNYL